MKTSHAIAFSAAILAASDVISRLFSLAGMMVLARGYGPGPLGILAWCGTLGSFAVVVAGFGMDSYMLREIGRNPEKARTLAGTVTTLKLLLFAAESVILVLIGLTTGSALKQQVLLLTSTTAFFAANAATAYVFFRARMEAGFQAVSTMLLRLAIALGGAGAVWLHRGIRTVAVIDCIAQVLVCLLAWVFFTNLFGRPRIIQSFVSVYKLLVSVWRFALLQLFNMVLSSIDMVMLPLLASDTAVGLYSAVVRLTSAFSFIPSSLFNSVMPALSKRSQESLESYLQILKPYVRIQLLLGASLCAMILVAAPQILALLYGPKFLPAKPAMMILAFSLFLIFTNWPLSTVMMSREKEGRMIISSGCCAAVSVLANLTLIPVMQERGAAISAVASQAVMFGMQYWCLGADLRKATSFLSAFAAACVPLAFIGALTFVSPKLHLPFIAHCAIALAGFVVAALASGAVGKREFALVKDLLRAGKRREGDEGSVGRLEDQRSPLN